MSPVKDHSCLDLVFKFPNGCTHWDRDLEHIKTKVMTHRSNHSCEIGVDASCYYEAAKTLLFVLDLFFCTGRMRKPFSKIELAICPDKTDGVPYVKLDAWAQLPVSEFHNIDHQLIISMVYTNADTVHNEDGIFVIKTSITTEGGKFVKSFVLGDSNRMVAEYVTPASAAWDFLAPRGDDTCWLSGPVLKYSENFPAPSIMIDAINTIFDEVEHQYEKWEKVCKVAAANASALAPATCVAGWTKIMTDEGEVEIRNLAGTIARAWNGQVYSVVTVEALNDDRPSKIITFNNHKQLFVTQDHVFIMSDGTTKTALELSFGDCLAAWTNPDGTADVVCVSEIQEGPVLGTVYHAIDTLQNKMMYNGIITVN